MRSLKLKLISLVRFGNCRVTYSYSPKLLIHNNALIVGADADSIDPGMIWKDWYAKVLHTWTFISQPTKNTVLCATQMRNSPSEGNVKILIEFKQYD